MKMAKPTYYYFVAQKVSIVQQDNDYVQVEFPDGSKGWVLLSKDTLVSSKVVDRYKLKPKRNKS